MSKISGNQKQEKRLTVQIGANLRAFRKRACITQRQAASLIGVSYQQLQKYEQGTNRISADYLYILKTAYGASYEDFFKGVKTKVEALPEDPLAASVFMMVAALEDEKQKKKIKSIVHLILS